jgi:hypothetical protein
MSKFYLMGAVMAALLAAAAACSTPGPAPAEAPVPGAPRPVAAPLALATPAARAGTVPAAAAPTLFEVETEVAALRARGAGEEAVYRLRALSLPARSVAMLMEREQAEKGWAQRLEAYRAAQQRIPASDTAQQKRLRETAFSPAEQALLDAAAPAVPQLLLPDPSE